MQERRITKSLKQIGEEQARTQMVSGALWIAKSDVVSESFQIECKTKEKASKSIAVKKEWLDKIDEEAFENGKLPALVISFGTRTDYFVLRDRDFLALYEELIELRKAVKE
ncbi:putative PDDEXK endonuclease (plasmid) [Paenibacillus sp. S-38]|uniref:putative PDDEXK endonuclease n=1 Tax=Paenibacillus sp. S-38 TaxID=3416710 RepID=UPI003CEDC882